MRKKRMEKDFKYLKLIAGLYKQLEEVEERQKRARKRLEDSGESTDFVNGYLSSIYMSEIYWNDRLNYEELQFIKWYNKKDERSGD